VAQAVLQQRQCDASHTQKRQLEAAARPGPEPQPDRTGSTSPIDAYPRPGSGIVDIRFLAVIAFDQ
jgi:hypothetical protein